MTIDFDCSISRSDTYSFKYDACAAYFDKQNVIPLWVADMDFAVPESVQHALIDRARHPIYGYTIYPESLYDALIAWLHVSATNPFSIVAFEAAYREGTAWLDELLDYLAGTRDFVRNYLLQQVPKIKLIEPEGTYLLWLDCRAMGLGDKQLKQFFVQEAGVGLSQGVLFGEQGNGFVRMNIGAPRSVITQALDKIARAVRAQI